MKYEIGDEILVLHSNEEGRVIEILSDEMVMIEVRGVKFPAYLDQIDFPYFKRFSAQKIVPTAKQKEYIDDLPVEKKPVTNLKETDGLWLSLIPRFVLDDFNDEVVESFKLYLVNHTNDDLHFIYRQLKDGISDFELTNDVSAGKDFYLHDVDFEFLNDKPSFRLTVSLRRPQKGKKDAAEISLKLKSKQVFQKIEELKEKNDPTIAYQLFEVFPDKDETDEKLEKANSGKLDLSTLSGKGFNVKYSADRIREHLPAARSVVDLHIEKLTDKTSGMSNFEMLTLVILLPT